MIVSLRIWNPHFPYYEGMTINRDIVARVAFETIDTAETEKEKVLVDNRTPYVYVRNNDPDILKENINTIYRIVKEAAQAESFDQLSPELQQQFMVPDDSQDSGATPGTRNIWKFLRKNPTPEEKEAVTATKTQDENKIIVAEQPKIITEAPSVTEAAKNDVKNSAKSDTKSDTETENTESSASVENAEESEDSENTKKSGKTEKKAPLKGLEKVLAPTVPENLAAPAEEDGVKSLNDA
ncbi:MAG: hypothetical protein Q4C70_05485, partial [Planctomycetia bacterium]|nr:hypothetical protein [Planctomycetia bacterium]